MSRPGYVGLEGEPWAQRSWEVKNPEGSKGAEGSWGFRKLRVHKLLGAGKGGIMCLGKKTSWGSLEVLGSAILGVGHSGAR